MRTKVYLLTAGVCMLPVMCAAQQQQTSAQKANNRAQQIVDSVLASHPDISGIEVATTPPGETGCRTVAATEAKEVGEKCDKDELTALRTRKPFVESEVENGKRVYDITAPLHDANGKIVGTAGIDVRSAAGQSRASAVKAAMAAVHELERQIPSKSALFERVR